MKGKLLLWVLVMLLVIGSVSAADVILAQNLVTPTSPRQEWGRATQLKQIGQSFILNGSGEYELTSIELYAKDVGTPNNQYMVRLSYNESGVPGGNVVGLGQISGGFASVFGAGLAWYNFTFNSTINLNASQDYWISLLVSAENNGNYIAPASDNGQLGYPQGKLMGNADGGAWADNPDDLNFRIWGSAVSPPTFNQTSPANETTLQSAGIVYFNVTATSAIDATFNLSLWFNNSINHTWANIANNTLQTWNISFGGIEEADYLWFFSATDSNGQTNSTIKTLVVDSVNPVIVNNFTNATFYFKNNISAWFNFSDGLLLHRYNISIDGVGVQGNDSIGVKELDVFFNYDTSSLTAGLHTLNVTIADGHTASVLKGDYDFENGLFNDYAKYEFTAPYEYGSIKVSQKDSSIFDSWKSEKQVDRYVFSFEPGSKKESYTFVVEAENNIYIIDSPNSPYKKWLVYGSHWLDFMPYQDVSIERVSSNKVEVTISDAGIENIDKLSFNSIGDLNIVTETFNFYTTNASITYPAVISELQSNNIILRINTTGIISTAASLVWNGTSKASTKTSVTGIDTYTSSFVVPIFPANANLSFHWLYNITGSINNESGNVSANQTLIRIGIDNCTSYGLRGVNISVINSSSDAKMNSTGDGFLKISIDDISTYKSFNLSFSYAGALTHGICINPNGTTFNMTGQTEFFIGSVTKTYYFNNFTVSNVTQNIELLYDDGSTLVTFTVTDENDNAVENAYITVLKYDFGTDTYFTSEILKTDSEGVAVGNLVLSTQWYKFVITYNSQVFLETSPTKIISTTYNFQIVLGSDYFANYNQLGSISCNVNFDNTTKIFSFTATDSSGGSNEYCLNVWKKTVNTNTAINSSCKTDVGTTINLGINEEVSDNTYVGIGSVRIGSNTFNCDLTTHSYNTGFKKFGQEGLFATFFIILTIVMIGIWSPIIAVMLMVLGIVISIIMGIFMLTWGSIVGLIIMAVITVVRLNKQ